MFKGYVPTARAPNSQSWDNLSNKINKLILDYNLKYTINIHVSILIPMIEQIINGRQ